MRIDLLDFSQSRTAPESVVRGLEELDPSACIVHLGGTRWMVGKYRPNALARAQAAAMIDNWTVNVREGKRMSPQGMARVRFAQLALLGVRPVELYTIHGAPDGRVVQDFARSRFRWLHTSQNAAEAQLDAGEQERQQASHAALTNPDLAKDAWQYAFTRSHMPSASLTPDIGPKAGWTRHTLSRAS